MVCECAALGESAVIDMANPGNAIEPLETLAERGPPWWWLWLGRCRVCGTAWLVAQEERQNDVFILRRLTGDEARGIEVDGRWPAYLDSYATLLELGRDAGHRVRFVDPLGDSSLADTIADVARERPGIGVPELAGLLNLDLPTARAVAEAAVFRHGAEVSLDLGPG